ncbi:MAG: LPS assembly lipoprotein LptE [Planctomycetota bacterium]
MQSTLARQIASLSLLAVWIGCVGCANYTVGTRALFRPDVTSVHVPAVQNETFRHDLGGQLHEAVVREIQLRTPYRVTGNPGADTVLSCRINFESKNVLTETASDDPRALDTVVSVQTTWLNRNGEMLMQNRLLPDAAALQLSDTSQFVPEAGGSIGAANADAMAKIASRIVDQMEMRPF